MSIATETTDSRFDGLPRDPGLGSMTDADLLDAWNRDAHSAALAAIVNRYSVMVLSVCRRRCRSEADADDAFQTTFLYLARNSEKIKQPQRLPGWLQRVAQRAAMATLKTKKHETQPMVDTPANPDDPLDRLTQRHEAIVLDEELADLPEHYRAALVMHIFDDQPLAIMADHFGTTIGSIRGRLQRGKQLLARRLRRRGVVPMLAFAASSAWTVSAASAAQASSTFIDATSGGLLPEPPIEPSLLNSLLNQGANVMSSLYTATGLAAGTALVALFLTNTPGDGSDSAGTVTLPSTQHQAVVAQFSAPAGQMGGEVLQSNKRSQDPPAGQVANMGGAMAAAAPAKQYMVKPVRPTPTSAVAQLAQETLDKEVAFDIATSFVDLAEELSAVIGVPVLVDDRAIAFAKVEPTMDVTYNHAATPVRSALRRMLSPLGLKAVIEDEGIVITTDPTVLVHRGIGVSRWINIDNDAEEMISEKLNEVGTMQFVDTPLSEVFAHLNVEHGVRVVIDTRGLDDIGIASDVPITIDVKDIKLRSALSLMLDAYDLTYTIHGESLLITTLDANDQHILNRIYWLEGTGFVQGDFDSIIDMITSTIDPDIWDSVGGPSTLSPMAFSRPALMIGTTYETHQNIEQLLTSLRESHFGNDPVLESVELPEGQVAPGGFGGGSGFGGGGGGMGGFGGGGGLGAGQQGGGGFF